MFPAPSTLAPFSLSALLLSAPFLATAAAEASTLRVEGRIRHVLPADLDGDGRRELLVLHVEGRGRTAVRRASLFAQTSGALDFAATPRLTWELPTDEAILDVGPDGDGEALFSLRRDGVYRYAFDGDPPRARATRIGSANLATLRAETDDVLAVDFARRWRGERLSFLAPTVPEPILVAPCADGVHRAIALPVEADAHYLTDDFATELTDLRTLHDTALPEPLDGATSVVFYRRERLLSVELPAPGDCPERLEGVREFPVEIQPTGKDAWEPQATLTRLVDVDGDGHTDLVAVVFRDSGLLELEGSVRIFRARGDGSFPKTPDHQLRVDDGQYYLSYVENVDGQGPLEIVTPTASIGVFGFIKLLTRRKVSFRLNTFESRAGGYWPARPIDPPLSALVSDRFDLAPATLSDVTGDGLVDLVMAVARNRICLRRGIRGVDGWELAPRPDLCFDGDAFDRHQLADLDRDGREELLLIGVREERRRELRVVELRAE